MTDKGYVIFAHNNSNLVADLTIWQIYVYESAVNVYIFLIFHLGRKAGIR
jgi:hypothetical protein